MTDRIRVDRNELFTPNVDAMVAQQEAAARQAEPLRPVPLWRRIIFRSFFFLAVAGLLGGFLGQRRAAPIETKRLRDPCPQ